MPEAGSTLIFETGSQSRKGGVDMTLRIGDRAPNFKARTTHGPIDLYDWMGDDWALLFSHPADFTPVCTTELGEVARMQPEFERRGVKVIGLSADTLDNHEEWVKDIEDTQGVKLNYPVIADPDHNVADRYDMLHTDGDLMAAGRTAFVIDSDKRIRLMITYPESTGRNFDEILRAIDSLKLTTDFGLATPVNWVRGQDVIVPPSLSADEVERLFPKGYTEVNRYLRTAADPAS
jgi:alkyl hydroperoxide reductase subunit AhpC